jgi:Transport and Golgi organisation 2
MCTVVISLAPDDEVPLLLLGVRDELTGRPWQPPARHWPGSPLIGGLDQQAGGTWLAVHPAIPRVACILNGRGREAEPAHRRSRGELPLRAAAEGPQVLQELHDTPEALEAYDPFHLVHADRATATLLSWDGTQAVLTSLPPATHVLTNAGHAYPPGTTGTTGTTGATDPKAARFGPKFAASRPSGDPKAATIQDAWRDWLTLAGGDGLAPADPAAIIARRELPDGRIWGSTSQTLIALARDNELRYDFRPVPGAWQSIKI